MDNLAQLLLREDISVRNKDGTFKTTKEIIVEIAKRWDSISIGTKKALYLSLIKES